MKAAGRNYELRRAVMQYMSRKILKMDYNFPRDWYFPISGFSLKECRMIQNKLKN